MFALKEFLTGLGATSLDCRQDGAKLDARCRAAYLFNTTIAGIENADACLLVGTNPRWEAPLVNARLRKRYLQGGFRVAAIGPALDLTFPVEMLGDGGAALNALAAGDHPWAAVLRDAKNPMIVVGQGALARPDGARVLGAARRIAESWRAGSRRLERVQCSAPRRRAGRRPRSRLCAGSGRARCQRHRRRMQIRRHRNSLPSRRRRDRYERSRISLCDLPGPSRRPWCPSRRCRPAGRRLHREGRHLRQYRGPRAAGAARGVPARRGARGLEDRARSFRRHRPSAAFRCAARSAPPNVGKASGIGRGGCGDAAPVGGLWGGGAGRRRSLRISDRGFLPHRSDQPRQPHHGAVQRAFCASGGTSARHGPALMANFWTGYAWPTVITAIEVVIVVVPLLLAIAMLTYAERKVLGVLAAPQGTECRRPVRPAAAFRRRPQTARQGDHRPERREPGGVRRRAADHLHIGARCLGGHPVRSRGRDRQHQCRDSLSVCDQLARRLRDHPGRLGVEFPLCLPRRAALGGADGLLRGGDRLCPRHRAAVRGLAQPDRDRRGAAPYLVCDPAAADVRDLLHLRVWPRPDARRSTCRRAKRRSSPAILSNIRR